MKKKFSASRGMIILIVCITMLAIPASAKPYHITLLSVGESGSEMVGGTADAYLEIEPGSGRIFLDSFPLTKLDTQISTRYANKIACDYLDYDCSRQDFFYTIRADSSIVGGPSASGALTILTIAALNGLEINNSTVMTGTINSGGSIGPVGGIPLKIGAAEKAGFKIALIPRFSIEEEENITANISGNPIITTIKITTSNNRSKNISQSEINVTNKITDTSDTGKINISRDIPKVRVIKISSLDEALPFFISKNLSQGNGNISVPPAYSDTMKNISDSLCSRASSLRLLTNLNESELNKTLEYERNINVSISENNYYSAASYCFNMGVLFRKSTLRSIGAKNHVHLELVKAKAIDAVREFDTNLEKLNLTTLSQLEAYIIVKERIIESEGLLLEGNISSDDLAYALERYYSAISWSAFFSIQGKPIEIDEKYLEEACYKKLSEAEERINYANLYLPSILQASRSDIDDAYAFQKDGNNKMCLFKASYAKADANLLLSSLSVKESEISQLADEKLKSAGKLIAREEKRGFFPVMGYSYYEYASSLKKNGDEASGLIFSEYSLELSNLEMYFPKIQTSAIPLRDYYTVLLVISIFILGFASGALLIMGLYRMKHPMHNQPIALKAIKKRLRKGSKDKLH
jgi:uncharacterized protein